MPQSEGRAAYLNGKTAEQRAAILERAAQIGPGPDEADWLIALAAEDAAKTIERQSNEAAGEIRAAVGGLTERVSVLGPMAEAVKEMASDLRRLRASVASGKAPGRWAMYGMVCVGLVLGLVLDALAQQFGVRSHQQLWLSLDGLRLIAGWTFSVAALGAGVTWLLTRC